MDEISLPGLALCILTLICLALALHPFTTYPISLRLLARLRPRPLQPGHGPAHDPTVAMCVCAYNEEGVIAARVDNMLALRRRTPHLEILVYVDAATDRTVEILRRYGEAIRVVVGAERHGKTHGMNRLVGMTGADIVVFSDANVSFAEDALQRLVAPFADPSVGCVCGHLVYLEPGQAGPAPSGEMAMASGTAAAGSLYWRLEEHIKALESATGSVMGADGSIFALRRSLHAEVPRHLIDDMYVSLAVLTAGARVVRAQDAVAYEIAVSRPAEEFRRKVRIACQAFNVNRALWPQLMRLSPIDLYKYFSHKLLRWLVIYFLALAVIFGCAAVLLLAGPWPALAAAVLGAGALGLLLTSRNARLAQLREILAAFLATGIGVWRSLRGETFQTWNPPASARAAGGSPSLVSGAPV